MNSSAAHPRGYLARPDSPETARRGLGLPSQGYAQRDRAIEAFVKVGREFGVVR